MAKSQVFNEEAYEYTKRDLEASVSCPQCRAMEMLKRIPNDCAYSFGQRMAAYAAAFCPHECGKKQEDSGALSKIFEKDCEQARTGKYE